MNRASCRPSCPVLSGRDLWGAPALSDRANRAPELERPARSPRQSSVKSAKSSASRRHSHSTGPCLLPLRAIGVICGSNRPWRPSAQSVEWTEADSVDIAARRPVSEASASSSPAVDVTSAPLPWDVLVVGGLNTDFVGKGAGLPRAGETLNGDTFHQTAGGKSANQAVAVARFGGRVALE